MNETQIQRMVDRFLNWKLPETFNPDGGITFKRYGNEGAPHQYERQPVGTNLFTAVEARQMIEHMLAEDLIVGGIKIQADSSLPAGEMRLVNDRTGEVLAKTKSQT